MDKQFGRGRITYLLNQAGYENREFGELMDSEIRSFLRKSGMNDFVSLVETNFGESRFLQYQRSEDLLMKIVVWDSRGCYP